MKQLHIKLKNCFGIKSFDTEFSFVTGKGSKNSVLIYAPNGTMKTSFASTLRMISEGKEEYIMDRVSEEKGEFELRTDENTQLDKERILVIDGDNKEYDSSSKISEFLASPELKAKYESIHKELSEGKKSLITKLKATSKSGDCEKELAEAFETKPIDLFELLKYLKDDISNTKVVYTFKYNDVFDKKGKVKAFVDDNLNDLIEYQTQYNNLISNSKLYGVNGSNFGTYQSQQIEKSTKDDSFFKAGHKIVLSNNLEINSNESYRQIEKEELDKILSDQGLQTIFKRIDKKLTGNNELRVFKDFLRIHPDLLVKVMDYEDFQKEVWISFLSKHKDDVNELINLYELKKEELEKINNKAKEELDLWRKIIDTYNSRFLVPFTVKLKNVEDVILQSETASLDFFYGDAEKQLEKEKMINVLSKGEQRAFFILQLLFEIESMKKVDDPGLLVFDDIADSFDYKNKYAIVEYLKDLISEGCFRLIILTHNFDFFRTVRSRINKGNSYFTSIDKSTKHILCNNIDSSNTSSDIIDPFKDWKKDLKTPAKFISCIPFIRNLVEYSDVNKNEEYTFLTSFLHLKNGTKSYTLKDLIKSFNKIITGLNYDEIDQDLNFIEFVYSSCDDILTKDKSNLFLANKICLSIGIRLKAEDFMLARLHPIEEITSSQTGVLLRKYKERLGNLKEEKDVIIAMSKVCLMTPENIHLNSFMYEPLLDMDIHHLVDLYKKVTKLYDGFQARINMN